MLTLLFSLAAALAHPCDTYRSAAQCLLTAYLSPDEHKLTPAEKRSALEKAEKEALKCDEREFNFTGVFFEELPEYIEKDPALAEPYYRFVETQFVTPKKAHCLLDKGLRFGGKPVVAHLRAPKFVGKSAVESALRPLLKSKDGAIRSLAESILEGK